MSTICSPFSPSFSNTKQTHCMLGQMRIIWRTVAIFDALILSYFCAGLREYDKVDGGIRRTRSEHMRDIQHGFGLRCTFQVEW